MGQAQGEETQIRNVGGKGTWQRDSRKRGGGEGKPGTKEKRLWSGSVTHHRVHWLFRERAKERYIKGKRKD